MWRCIQQGNFYTHRVRSHCCHKLLADKSINRKNLKGNDSEFFLEMKQKEEQGRLVSQQVMVTLKNETPIEVDYQNFCYWVIYYKCKMKTI